MIAATRNHLAAEAEETSSLERTLEAAVPENWPPELYDRPALDFSLNYLKENPDAAGWVQWYVLLRDGEKGNRTAAGICGLKGRPQADGMAEIGYSLLSQFQGSGLATEAVGGLLKWAFAQPTVTRIVAETYPELKPSIRVLEKNGFRLIGAGSEPGVIRFELSRSSYIRKIQQIQRERK